MSFERLIAGVAVAALMAGTASAQTQGSATASQTGGSMQSGGYNAPYASPPINGGAAQPSAAGAMRTTQGGATSATGQGMTSQGMSSQGMGAQGAGAQGMASQGQMSTGASTTGAMGPGAAGFRPVQAVPGANIIATLQASGEFTKLLAALQATNLTGLISTHPNLTLFAPTDAAFAALPPGQLDTLMKSPPQLQAILTYHLVATAIKEGDIKGHSAGQVPAADNKKLNIDGSGAAIKVDDATVLQSPVMASNGFIYPIDKVLTPPAT